MGNEIILVWPKLRVKNSNKIASTSRLHGTLDTFDISKLKTSSLGLDTLYRWGLGHLGVGASIMLIAPSGLRSKYAARLAFKATNNIAKYEGLILRLNKVKALGAKTILVKIDS